MSQMSTRRLTMGVAFSIASLSMLACLSNSALSAEKVLVRTSRVPNEGIAPQALTDDKGSLHMIYFKGDPAHGNIFYCRLDDGQSFTPPIQVNSQAESAIAIGTVRVPQMAFGKNGRVHVAWMGSATAEPKVGDNAAPMLYTRMNDVGDAFEPQRNLVTKRSGLDGGSVAADSNGNVYVAWHAPKDGNSEADRCVWIAVSKDEGKSFSAEHAANPKPTGSCGCCGMKIAAAPDGEVFVLYRSATDMVNRDMYLLSSKDHARTFLTVALDPWRLDACAMSTATFGGNASQMVGAWETKGHIRFAVGQKGKKFTSPFTVPGASDKQKYPSLAVNSKGEFVVAWAEDTAWGKGGSVAWQVFDKSGAPIAGQSGRADGLPAWSMPASFIRDDGTFGIIF